MDQSREIIDQVLARMSDKLTSDQLTLLEANMIISMHGMTVEREHTELAVQNRNWEWYLSRFRATKRLKNCTESTLRQYEYAINKLREYVPKMPQDMRGDDIKYFLAVFGDRNTVTSKKPVSKTYINNMKNNLGSFFAWMYDEGYISKNPVKTIPVIKINKTIRHAYNGEDMEKMKSAARNVRDMALIYFLDATGCRISEAISINKDDINWERRSVVVRQTKGKADREVLFTEECAYRLREYLKAREDDDPALFVKEKAPHSRLTKSGAEYIVRTIGQATGVHAYPHRFRRTMITRCNRRGMPLQDIQTLAGHTNAQTTQIYIDMAKESVRSEYERCS